MPELPEVQTVVNDLICHGITRKRIAGFRVAWRRTVNGHSDRYLRTRLLHRGIRTVSRRGKYIVFTLDDDQHALLHLRMSGRLHMHKQRDPWCRHEHFALRFSDGTELRLHDTRKFARFYIGPETAGRLDALGPEPLDPAFRLKDLKEMLVSRDRMLKPLLLDQSVLAGLGNIYTDEILFAARLHPQSSSRRISDPEFRHLFQAIRRILRQAVRNCGTSLGIGANNFRSLSREPGRHRLALKVYGRAGQPCPRCRATLQRLIVAQRSTHVCPGCQTKRGG